MTSIDLTVRVMLDRSRESRHTLLAGGASDRDTVHMVRRCGKCGVVDVLSRAIDANGRTRAILRNKSLAEAAAMLVDLATAVTRAAESVEAGPPCVCGASMRERVIVAARLIRTMSGSGADLVLELDFAGSPASEPVASFRAAVLRAPHDGVEHRVSDSLDDAALDGAFGRRLALTTAWHELFAMAKSGSAAVRQVETGIWLFGGTMGDPALALAIERVTVEAPATVACLLRDLGALTVGAGDGWQDWSGEFADGLRDGSIHAGVLLDRVAVETRLRWEFVRAGMQVESRADAMSVVARDGEAEWPLDPMRAAAAGLHLGWTLADAMREAASETAARLRAIGGFLSRVRALRPAVAFEVRGTRCTPRRADGSEGMPIDLRAAPFEWGRSEDFERELRVACDPLPPYSDPTRVCPCFAPAVVCRRLFPWSMLSRVETASEDLLPIILGRWPAEKPTAAAAVTVGCDRHARLATMADLAAAGIDVESLLARIDQDVSSIAFPVDLTLRQDSAGRRAVLAVGPFAASMLLDEHLIAGLNDVCGRPLPHETLEARAISPNVLLVYQPAIDREQLAVLVAAGARADGLAPDGPYPFVLVRPVRADALPIGRFVPFTARVALPQDTVAEEPAVVVVSQV